MTQKYGLCWLQVCACIFVPVMSGACSQDNAPTILARHIVFVSDRSGSQNLYLYDTVVHSLVGLPGLNAIDMIVSSPGISEDGRLIVFAGSREGRSSIYLYDRETRQLRNLIDKAEG